MSGGAESQVYRVTVDGAHAATVVVKTCTAARLVDDPDLFTRQAQVLAAVRSGVEAVPRPLFVDADGSLTGQACLIMDDIHPASAYIPAAELTKRCFVLGAMLARIHDTAAPAEAQPWRAGRYPHFGVPALEQFNGVITPASQAVFAGWCAQLSKAPVAEVLIHGDFHPGNVLWGDDGRVAGVVDWDYPSLGAAGFDLAHCRADLVLIAGTEAAQALLAGYEQKRGPVADMALWDVHRGIAALASFPLWMANLAPVGFPLDEPVMRARLTEFVRLRAASLTG
ncbi:aminoglycoside phosphotransferase family protein [Actinoplanes sp. NPDC051475]|uniref:aminoglycoside phosphotransferase family protein n=1 Tax=Actinoplanes sp. NPDC051475 TaxID=3157225 RepID=UPI003450B373